MSWLPSKLPTEPTFAWRAKLTNQGVGGIAATSEVVLVSDRDAGDGSDIFRCLEARDGTERWFVRYPAPGRLDYGNSPRATPLIHDGRAYLFGAMGTLTCVEIADGKIVWRRELQREFPSTEKLPWGLASSPLIVDGKLIVQTSSRAATLLALDPKSGRTLWQAPGDGPAFASFVVATFGGRKQLIGYDRTSLGGWDPATGERIWKLVPPQADDFNVPTPIVTVDALIVASENNGTRLYRFDAAGKIVPKPESESFDLAPDTHSPVLAGGRVFGIWGRLFCLDAKSLKEIYVADDEAFDDYASLIASDDRVLALTQTGEILLFDAKTPRLQIIGRLKLFVDATGVFSHPALVGDRLYVRGNDEIVCLRLPPN